MDGELVCTMDPTKGDYASVDGARRRCFGCRACAQCCCLATLAMVAASVLTFDASEAHTPEVADAPSAPRAPVSISGMDHKSVVWEWISIALAAKASIHAPTYRAVCEMRPVSSGEHSHNVDLLPVAARHAASMWRDFQQNETNMKQLRSERQTYLDQPIQHAQGFPNA